MFCTACGRQLAEGTGYCPACGTAASPSVVPPPGPAPSHLRQPQSLTAVTDFLHEVASVSLKEIVLVDGDRAAEILRSPVFLLLSLVAIVPLAIQSLESAHSILYGLAIWSGLLWALLMYRLFADRQVGLFWCLATVFFTAFIGIPLLGLYLQMPGQVFELIKAIPLFLVAYFTTRMKNPVMGMVLGMMSGIGFSITENVFYVFTNLSQAVGAVRSTGQVGHLVGP